MPNIRYSINAMIRVCSFKLKKRAQLFIRTHNETLSVVAMRVCNPDRSPIGITRSYRFAFSPTIESGT